jgi:hypothetical protein
LYRHRNGKILIIAEIFSEAFGTQSVIFCDRLCVQPSKSFQLVPIVIKRLIVLLVEMTVFDQHTGHISFRGMTDYAVIIFFPVI